MIFSLSNQAINSAQLRIDLENAASGAINSFEGMVRNHNQGRQVTALEYEAHNKLCDLEIQKIFNEIRNSFDVNHIICQHRTGRLEIGATAVWIGVSAPHRDHAFKACRYLIDELKSRLPIWKKEFYAEGDSGWINCTTDKPKINRDQYYSRQIRMPRVGINGQSKIEAARVLVVGAGGLGASALLGLAGAGIGTIGICEHDLLDESNLHRQFLYTHGQIGQPKVIAATQRLLDLNPSLHINSYNHRITSDNVKDLFNQYDLVLDCTDNFRTKFLLNDAAVLLKKPLIQASIYQNDAQLNHVMPGQTGCLRCIWSEIPEAGCTGNCEESGVFGDVPAMIGHLQSLQVLQYILGDFKNIGKTLIYNFTHHTVDKIANTTNPECPVCGTNPSIKNISSDNYHTSIRETMDVENLTDQDIQNSILVDVRESYERVLNPLHEIPSLHHPCSQLTSIDFKYDATKKYFIFCAKGIRSLSVVKDLHAKGVMNVISLDNTFTEIKQRLIRWNESDSSSKEYKH